MKIYIIDFFAPIYRSLLRASHRGHQELLKVNPAIAISISQLYQLMLHSIYFLSAGICPLQLPKQPLKLRSSNISIFININHIKGFPQLRHLLLIQHQSLAFFGFSNIFYLFLFCLLFFQSLLSCKLGGGCSFSLISLNLFLKIWICET